MESLVCVLVKAQNPTDPDFQKCHDVLMRSVAENPVALTVDLAKIVCAVESPPIAVFLALVLINKCFQDLMIPFSEDHPYVESGMAKMDVELLNLSFTLFGHQYAPIRNAAVKLFGSVVSTQARSQPMGVMERLIGLLTARESVESVISAIEVTRGLLIFRICREDGHKKAIAEALFAILNRKDGDQAMIKECLSLLGDFAKSLPVFFGEGEKFAAFVVRVCVFFQDVKLRKALYELMGEIVEIGPMLLVPVFDGIVATSLVDLASSVEAVPGLKAACIVFWINVINASENSDEFFARIVASIPPITERLLAIMGSIETDEVPDFTEWEPAAECLSAMTKRAPEAMTTLLLTFTATMNASRDQGKRECALKALRIVLKQTAMLRDANENVAKVFSIILERMGDTEARVRFEAVSCLRTAVKVLSGTWTIFQPFMSALRALTCDVARTGKLSLRVMREVMLMRDFDQCDSVFEVIVGIVASVEPEIAAEAVLCMYIPGNDTISVDVAVSAFNFLHERLRYEIQTTKTHSFAYAACMTLSDLLKRGRERLSGQIVEVYETMIACITTMNVGSAFSVIGAIAMIAPAFIGSVFPGFLPILLEGHRQVQDQETLLMSVAVVPRLYNLASAEFQEAIVRSLGRAMSEGRGAVEKAAVLDVFVKLIEPGRNGFPLMCQLSVSCVQFLIMNLDEAARRYGASVRYLIGSMCDLIAKIVKSNDSLSESLFATAVALLSSHVTLQSTVAQQPTKVVRVILSIRQKVPEEAMRRIWCIPHLFDKIALGLHASGRDPERIQIMLTPIMPNE